MLQLALAAFLVLTTGAVAATDDPQHLGVATCASSTCHGAAKTAASGNIQANEYVIWSRHDPHAGAYSTLLEERSRVMAKRLGIGAPERSADCLNCHTDNVATDARGPRFQLDDGIGCETCHGGAEAWLASHDDRSSGTRAASLAAGMVDLTDPATRAEVCMGCHIGADTSATRFASHRLMAAGHPRLGFELDTFTELWRSHEGRTHFRRDADYLQRKPEPASVQVWARGLAAAAAVQAKLIAARRGEAGALPDFALFNCYSCHRAMRLDDWRDKAEVGGEPGALRFDDSAITMLLAALGQRPTLRDALQRDSARLQAAAGAPTATARSAAATLSASLNRVLAELERKPLSATESEQALATLARAASRGAYPDYTRAEQAAMGVVILAAGTGKADQHRAAIDALFQALEDDDRYDPRRFGAALDALGR